MHHPEVAEDGVEAAVVKRQGSRVALLKHGARCGFRCQGKHLGRKIQPHGARAGLKKHRCQAALTAAEVEDIPAFCRGA